MLQNKIYQNFLREILKTFFTILLGFSLIALTVRSVNFLDLIVDSGYAVSTYFEYSFLNIFGILPKFIPLSFLISLILFIVKHKEENELMILWSSGVKKITMCNFFFYVSLLVFLINIVFSTLITPYALNKSRQILKNQDINSFLPTVRSQQFSDSFDSFTFFVDKKLNNEMQNIFLNDEGQSLKNFSSNSSNSKETVIFAKAGIVENKNLLLIDGQIISTSNKGKDEIINFDQLKINLNNLATTTIKAVKIQETSTLKLISCFFKNENSTYCNDNFKKEIISTLNRRILIPIYVPVLSLICSIILLRSNKFYLSKVSVYFYSFLLLLFTELGVRYTGIYNIALYIFISLPIILSGYLYFYLSYKFSNELKKI